MPTGICPKEGTRQDPCMSQSAQYVCPIKRVQSKRVSYTFSKWSNMPSRSCSPQKSPQRWPQLRVHLSSQEAKMIHGFVDSAQAVWYMNQPRRCRSSHGLLKEFPCSVSGLTLTNAAHYVPHVTSVSLVVGLLGLFHVELSSTGKPTTRSADSSHFSTNQVRLMNVVLDTEE